MKINYLVLLGFLLAPYALHADGNKNCSKKLNEINERFGKLYLDLEGECYPEPDAYQCGFELSSECQAKYEAIGNDSTAEYEALAKTCPDLFANFEDSVSIMSKGNQRAPSKKELSNQVRSLKKKLRNAEARNKKLQAKRNC
jgi:hypothetical protein